MRLKKKRPLKVKYFLHRQFKYYMKLRKWKVADLARQLKMNESQVSAIVGGKIEPSMNFLHRLSVLTKLGAEEILETKFYRR